MKQTKTNTFKEFFKNNLEHQDRLNKTLEPLQRNFGIDDFWHLTLHENGLLANVSTFYDQWGYFWETGCYHNSNFMIAPSCLKAGAFQLEFDINFAQVMTTFVDKYPQHHPLIIIHKDCKDKAHIFGFCARKHSPHLPSFYLNNLAVLNSFIKHYLITNKKFSTTKEENMIDISALRGFDCYYKRTYGQECLIQSAQICDVFKKMGTNSFLLAAAKRLSLREKQVLVGLSEGKTASQSADKLGLSPRTIQFYLENAKNKLGTTSRAELIQNLEILKLIGLLV